MIIPIYSDLAHFESDFLANKINLKHQTIDIGEKTYTVEDHSPTSALFSNNKVITVLCCEDSRLALVWNNEIEDSSIKLTPSKVLVFERSNQVDRELDVNAKPEVITDEVDVVLVGFNENNPIKARVDTGAAQCCIHGEDIKWSNDIGMVQFTFDNRRYKMYLNGEQEIKSSDGGTQKRPVVQFRVKIAGKFFDGISFNINDRSNMPHKLLIGQNLLDQGHFLVDPSGKHATTESIELDANAIIEQLLCDECSVVS